MKREKTIKLIILVIVVLMVFGIFVYKNITRSKIETAEINLEDEVSIYRDEKSLPTLLKFGSTSCEPCRIMVPILEKIKKQYEGKLIVKSIDVYSDFRNTQKYNIRTIPTQIFLDSQDKVIYRHEGIMYEDEIIEKLNQWGIK